MPLGLSMGPSTASTATMFSFASSVSQMENHSQSAYGGAGRAAHHSDPYAQLAKSAPPTPAPHQPGKSRGFGKALTGLGKRAGVVFKRSSSMPDGTVVVRGSVPAINAIAAAQAQLAGPVSTNPVNSNLIPDRKSGFSEFSENCTARKSKNPNGLPASAPFVASSVAGVQAEAVASSVRVDCAASVSSSGRAKKKSKPASLTKVRHDYQDYSNVTDEDALQDQVERKNTGGVVTPFPEKLHEMLSSNTQVDVIDWAPHGRCFVIKKPKIFAATIMPKYFKHTKITSFQRQLNLYGFKRITKGKDRGAYYHELFLRGRPKLPSKMRRQRIKGVGHKPLPDPENEPDFYSMEPLDPPAIVPGGQEQGDAESLSQLSGGLGSIVASVHSNGLGSVGSFTGSLPLGASPTTSVGSGAQCFSGLSASSPTQQTQTVRLMQQQKPTAGPMGSGVSNELHILSQMLEQQRQQIELQQQQLQQRQQQLLQEELVMQQKEVLFQQEQQRRQQLQQPSPKQTNQACAAPAAALSLAISPAKQQQLLLQLSPAKMNFQLPVNREASNANMVALSGDLGMLEGSMPAITGAEPVCEAKPAVQPGKPVSGCDGTADLPPVLRVLAETNSSKKPDQEEEEEDPSIGGFSSLDSRSKRSSGAASKSTTSLSKRHSIKSWGSVGSMSKTSRASSNRGKVRKTPWSRKSHASASVSSGGSDQWIDDEQKMALEATIDFDEIFDGASVH